MGLRRILGALFALSMLVAMLLGGRPPAARGDGPLPGGLYAGLDDYDIAHGLTQPYSSQPLRSTPVVRSAATLPHTLYLPLLQAGSVPRETRALWVSRWDFRTLADIQAIVDKAAYAHMNTILFQVRGQADACYHSQLEPWSLLLTGTLGRDPGWDPLGEMVSRAHAAGIQVEAWINAYPAWLGTQDPATQPSASALPLPMYLDFNARYGNDWVQWTKTGPMQFPPPGPTYGYVCGNPAHPAVAERIVAVCKDVLTNYPVDGLHFDYIRYDGAQYSYDPLSERAYAAALAAEPGLARGEWQRRQVTGLLERVRQEALPLRPGARLTTTAWPVYVDHWNWVYNWGGYNAYFQDAQGWARSGLASEIMPMLYGSSFRDYPDRFETLIRDAVAGSAPGPVIAGIIGDYDNFIDIAWRIEASRAAGAKGQALFRYRLLDERNYWQALRDGPYRRATQPY